jgi:hypothetical protein
VQAAGGMDGWLDARYHGAALGPEGRQNVDSQVVREAAPSVSDLLVCHELRVPGTDNKEKCTKAPRAIRGPIGQNYEGHLKPLEAGRQRGQRGHDRQAD